VTERKEEKEVMKLVKELNENQLIALIKDLLCCPWRFEARTVFDCLILKIEANAGDVQKEIYD